MSSRMCYALVYASVLVILMLTWGPRGCAASSLRAAGPEQAHKYIEVQDE